jgi:hypothetical protein
MLNKLHQLQHNTVNKAQRSSSVCTQDTFREIDSFYQIDLEAINGEKDLEKASKEGAIVVV